MHDEPDPKPREDEQVIDIDVVGICGSDLHWHEQAGVGEAQIDRPLVLGHEFGGYIHGADGQLVPVAVDPAIPCNQCRPCLEGHPNLCTRIRFAGYGTDDGGLRERVAWPQRCLYPLPAGMSTAEGAMLEPLGVALHAVDLGGLKLGIKAGVFGCGPIGLLIVRLLRMMGASQVIATDLLPHRLEVGRELGAQMVQASEEGMERSEVWSLTGDEGVDVAFEVAGENAAVETAIECARPGGTVILVGIPGEDRTSFQASTARRKGLTIKLARRMKFTYPRAIQLVHTGQVDVKSLMTHRYTVDDYKEAFETARRREGLKVIIEFRG
jgi:L-iditol 2-dehydrogenase